MLFNRNLEDFISAESFQNLKEFLKDKETPCLVINLNVVRRNFAELTGRMPYAKVYYAVKANPNPEVIKLLDSLGSNFDVATVFEMNLLLSLGISTEKMSYGNTIKKENDIEEAYKAGIRLFATDSQADLEKIARKAPGSKVFFRIIRESSSADWPLSRKFGAHPDMIYELILNAKDMGLIPYGISFHVGSQQRDIGQWDSAIAQCRYLFDAVAEKGIHLKLINMGGGFPAPYLKATQEMNVYTEEITRFLEEDFPDGLPEIIVEPGRSLAAESGIIVTEVLMITKKSRFNFYNWVFLDIGKFGGMIETTDEAIKYPIFPDPDQHQGDEEQEAILAGPTCDSADILYQDTKYLLPADLYEGERLYVMTAGAYTTSYSSIGFNGIPPLKEYVVEW